MSLLRNVVFTSFCVLALLAGVFAEKGPDGSPAVANATGYFDPVTMSASIIYQENVAGQQATPVTYYSYGTGTASTVSAPTETETMGNAASLVQTNQISYVLPLLAAYQDETDDSGQSSDVMAFCWYPVSGYYGRLARALFYGTMFFAVLAKSQEWLIVGALATGMTFTAVAALQVMIMVWSNQGLANPDGIVILGLIAFSLSMLVPLLSWSSTINKIGAERPEDSVGRSIIITWGLFLTIAFLFLFAGIWQPVTLDFNDPASVGKMLTTPNQYFWLSNSSNVTCTPDSGVFNLAAGQDEDWQGMYITTEFINENNCQDPCKAGLWWPSGGEVTTIFRDPSDLIVLSRHAVNTLVVAGTESTKVLTHEQLTGLVIASDFVQYGTGFVVLIILQGIWAVLLGRRSPSQIRNLVYWFFTHLLPRKTGKAQSERHWLHIFAKTAAIAVYAWTCLTSVFSVILIALSIFTTEYYMHEIPQSDRNKQVDQWSAMVATAMVLIVTMIFQFQGIIQDVIFRAANRVLLFIHNVIHRKKRHTCEVGLHEHLKEKDKGRSTNRSILADSFKGMFPSWAKVDADGVKAKSWRQDWKDFWDDARKVVKIHGSMGDTNVRSRRIAGEEHEELIQAWNKGAGDDWLDLEEFIAQCRKFDERSRMSGKIYRFKPRIIEESESEERTRLNWRLLRDIFRPHNGKYTWSSISGASRTDLRRSETDQTLTPSTTYTGSQNAMSKVNDEEEGIQLHSMAQPEQTLNPFAVKHYSPLS